ncbi:hypothetical protein C8P63_10691 [Melghirimyces profundicolus]|uniref:Uncharacterized protein n=1 Tax=Melghirimyces profundicolus TaxID=1242148 RepID=A0A2T6C0J4_9BACL|nr:hypothetical protein C8P63_10691 [Melghirimyces profundicolus]
MAPFICEVCGRTETPSDHELSAEDRIKEEILHICESCIEDRSRGDA